MGEKQEGWREEGGIFVGEFQKDQKEKEKEKEEEGQVRKRAKVWRPNSGKEEGVGPLSRDGVGPLPEDPKKGAEAGAKKDEEDPGYILKFVGKFFERFREWYRRGPHGRPLKNSAHQRTWSGVPCSHVTPTDEDVLATGHRGHMGNGRGPLGAGDEPICPHSFEPPGIRWPPQGSHESGLHWGPDDPKPSSRSPRCIGPTSQKRRDDGAWVPLEFGAEGGVAAQCRASDYFPGRNTGCDERSQGRFSREAKPRGLGQRSRKRKAKGAREGKARRERKAEGKGCSEERLLRSGRKEEEEKQWKMAAEDLALLLRRKKEEVGKQKGENRREKLRVDTKKRSEEGLCAAATSHLFPDAAATAEGPSFCTDFSSQDFMELSNDSLGLGQTQRKKDSLCDLTEVGMEDIFGWLSHRLDSDLGRLCKVAPTGKVFPLPTSFLCLTSLFSSYPKSLINVLRCLVMGLNSLNDEGVVFEGAPSPFQKSILKGLMDDCVRVLGWKERMAPISWGDFFAVRGIDYKGDEILNARPISWASVGPALPLEVGQVNLRDVVELGTKEYVDRFEDFLLPVEDQVYTKPPTVKVAPEDWEILCEKLLERGVFEKIHEDEVYRVQGRPVLNGLFGVSKNEFQGQVEIMRIIMNLIPANKLCRGLDSDIATLPSWSGMAPLLLMPDEDLVISSEDVRCFFYIFRLPPNWYPFMAFNRPLPARLNGDKPGIWYPCSAVLPMGFKNSVSIAQHVHRLIAKNALSRAHLGGELEMRKDKTFSTSRSLFRIYLDNFDELRRTSRSIAEAIEGKPSPLILGLRDEYQALGVPRHPKKAVTSVTTAEVQGAIIDGKAGLAFPKPEKILKYCFLASLVLEAGECTQKQAQVVGGGLVYLAMFRRPLLGSLNHLWKFIVGFDALPPVVRLPLPREVRCELARFVALVPLAFMDFRSNLSGLVTASDASTTGGGVTMSSGLTPAGVVASACPVRGDLVEPNDVTQVLTVSLFDGIGALRTATDVLGWNVVGHVGVEKAPEARRVVESRFPNTIAVSDVADIDDEMVKSWSLKFSQVGLILLGAGPPCQGVSGLNASRKGALRDARSSLFSHVPRVRKLLKQFFPWAQVQSLMESVASMDKADEDVMSESFGARPWHIDAQDVSLARRPRLYWVEWELFTAPGVFLDPQGVRQQVRLKAKFASVDYLLPGWKRTEVDPLPTFTTSRPRANPGYKPAGIHQCTVDELQRWKADQHRFPPYQYQVKHCLTDKSGSLRLPSIEEREVIMGFPRNFTMMCLPKSQQGSSAHLDCRLTLIGNSWSVPVVAWLLSQLGSPLGLNPPFTPQEIVQRCSPGASHNFYTFLQRPLMKAGRSVDSSGSEQSLVRKLMTSVSIKGEDILLNAPSEDMVRYQRLRASVPSKLWRWRIVCGWRWSSAKEHINVLEMRAVLTALRWRIERKKLCRTKFVHLIDSLVCLHSLSRGRSSSLKLKRSLLRINSLLLATHSQAVWAYVHTKDNPADAPSRAPRKRKWNHA